jgi:hypothetical protein
MLQNIMSSHAIGHQVPGMVQEPSLKLKLRPLLLAQLLHVTLLHASTTTSSSKA